MANLVETVEKEVIRKEVLMLLRMAIPTGCSDKVLETALVKEGIDKEKLKETLYYLKDKGLISLKNISNERLSINRNIYSITAIGIDYLDGNGADIPGVLV